MNFNTVFKSLVFISFSLWLGGFLFYSAFVIPSAHAVLHDHETVGMITQKATRILNYIGLISCLLLLINFIKAKIFLSAKELKYSAILLGLIITSLLALFFFHYSMSIFIDPDKLELSEYKKFYRLHRIYLIISTVQFFCLIGYIPNLIKCLNSNRNSL